MFSKDKRFTFAGRLPRKVISSKSFNLRYEDNNEGIKIAVVVSKKVDKRATVRNNLKRRVLEIVKRKIRENEAKNLVFYMKSANVENLEKEIEEAINKT
jgi:ribonuclease P protein component